MDEPEVSEIIRKRLEENGYRLTPQPPVMSTDREVVLDWYAWKDGPTPDIIWIECKGDQNISGLLEGFIRTLFATYHGGGRGMLVAPVKSIQRLQRYGEFFSELSHHVALVGV